jgi:hypothetical protein
MTGKIVAYDSRVTIVVQADTTQGIEQGVILDRLGKKVDDRFGSEIRVR